MLRQEIEDGQASLADPQFRHDVLTGLGLRPRAIPARWFYDRRGSELFEAITELPEYYPTRTEIAILADCCADLAQRVPAGCAVVEFGSGSSTKTPALLECVKPAAYVPIDISGDFLRESAAFPVSHHLQWTWWHNAAGGVDGKVLQSWRWRCDPQAAG